MRELAIDLETYSSEDIRKVGAYKYADAWDFEILLLGYSIDRGPVTVIDLTAGEEIPLEIERAIKHPRVIKTAYNANFERVCLARHYGVTMNPAHWRCTSVDSQRIGLPRSLGKVAEVLHLEQQKEKEGKALIKYFCSPCKPTKTNGGRTRNLPEHAPEKWEKFIDYCAQDVRTELAIREKIEPLLHVPEWEQDLWTIDQRINDRGIMVDAQLVAAARKLTAEFEERLTRESFQLTGLENPNSPKQLREWLELQGHPLPNLQRETVEQKAKDPETPRGIQTVLRNRVELGRAAVTKYVSLHNATCSDGRLRGVLQFYGASRTGRWAGRIFQPQNLTKNYLKDINSARNTIMTADMEIAELLYDETVNDLLSQLVRTALVAAPGHTFFISDFSAIEARVIAWLAGEQWRLDVFQTHGKIYEASAAAMFGVPVESIKKGDELRQKGKVAELACGYQGGPGALIQMGALDGGLTEEELPGIVRRWREASPNIVRLWKNVEAAALAAVREPGRVKRVGSLTFHVERSVLFITLPSGRRLAYPKARIVKGKYGDALQFMGQDTYTPWGWIDTYGGKLVENITQAVARDCLAYSMARIEEEGFTMLLHVHDEVVCEVPKDGRSLEELEAIMGEPIPWAPGLPLTADGFAADYYQKD